MRYATGGIGIDKVSMALTAISIQGNDKFRAWTKGGALVKRIVKPGDGQMTLVVGKGMQKVPVEANKDNYWCKAYTGAQKKLNLPKFGQTDPVGVTIVDDELHIVIPEASKRAKLQRGRNKATLEKQQAISETDTEETPPANTLEKVMRDVSRMPELPPTPSTDPVAALRQAVQRVNALVDELEGQAELGISYETRKLFATLRLQ